MIATIARAPAATASATAATKPPAGTHSTARSTAQVVRGRGGLRRGMGRDAEHLVAAPADEQHPAVRPATPAPVGR